MVERAPGKPKLRGQHKATADVCSQTLQARSILYCAGSHGSIAASACRAGGSNHVERGSGQPASQPVHFTNGPQTTRESAKTLSPRDRRKATAAATARDTGKNFCPALGKHQTPAPSEVGRATEKSTVLVGSSRASASNRPSFSQRQDLGKGTMTSRNVSGWANVLR